MGDAAPAAPSAAWPQIRKARSDQLNLAMEETEQAIAETGSAEETSNATLKASLRSPALSIAARPPSAPLILSFCWTHLRRRFYEIAVGGNAPLADAALVQIAALYKIEESIRGQSAEARCKVRQAKSRPLLEKFKSWLEKTSPLVPGSSKMAKAIRYALHHWDGLILFANDGRIEMDTNTVERSIRPLALNRKNALFAGHDRGAEHWGIVASLIETAKLNGVDPQAYLASVLSRLVNGWPMRKIDELLPWAYAASQNNTVVA